MIAAALARAVLYGEMVTQARWRIRRPDGSEVLAVGTARPVLGPEGQQVGAVLTVRDDTARAAATAAERRAERILEQISDAHVTFDRELRYVAVNAAGERSMRPGVRVSTVPPAIPATQDRSTARSPTGARRHQPRGDAERRSQRIIRHPELFADSSELL